jgi:hypothetical protein
MNLDIEGTKHEKVVIIVLAYVMGFTAGFICFGVSATHKPQNAAAAPIVVSEAAPAIKNTSYEADVTDIDPISETAATVAATGSLGATTVTYTDGKLQAYVGDSTYLLSVKSDMIDASEKSEFKNQGTHAAIPAYKVSPDSNFVYFCEQQTADDACTSFVFDVANNIIKYVSSGAKKVVTTAAVAKGATWSESGLTIDGKTSIDATNPVELGAE